MKIKTVAEWFAFFFVLLFLPAENRLIFFDMKPADWYGEFHISGGDTLMVVGKNSNEEKVNLDLPSASRTIIAQDGAAEGLFVDGPSDALPESIVIIESTTYEVELSKRRLMLGDKYYFTPGGLMVLTHADLYTICLMMAALMGAFLVLGFLVARHSTPEDDLA